MRHLILSLLVCFYCLPAHAHGPTPQKAKQSVNINAPVADVWQIVKQFDAIADWQPDLKHSTGNGLNQSGGTRTLTFQNNQTLVEELDYYNEQAHEYSYRLKTENPQAFPTSSHSIELKVDAGETPGTSVVTLKSRFYRGDTGNTPPADLSDEAAVQAMNTFFSHALKGLKGKAEQ